MNSYIRLLVILLSIAAFPLVAAEYFVSHQGNDANDGHSPGTAFRHIAKAFNRLKSGDTLTIDPGEYRESVTLKDFGDKDKNTVIKARLPGSVLMRGDLPASGFKPVEGYRFVYVADWKRNVNAVIEHDNLKIYLPSTTIRDLEFGRGLYYHDAQSQKLYISTADGKSPDNYRISVSVLDCGMRFVRSKNITIDGIMLTGFCSPEQDKGSSEKTSAGIGFLIHSENITVKRCRTFLNSNGILFFQSMNSLVDGCTAYGNGTPFVYEGGNIVFFSSQYSRISNCESFAPNNPQGFVIRFYGRASKNCIIENCRTFGFARLDIKPGTIKESMVINSYANVINSPVVRNSIRYNWRNAYNAKDSTPVISRFPATDLDKMFADPVNYDFRPQAGARGLENGLPAPDNVFFIAPDGDDSRPGNSVDNAWKSYANIKTGDTVYLLPGTYNGGKIAADNIILQTRGNNGRALITGGLAVNGNNVTLREINFIGSPVSLNGNDLYITGCAFGSKLTVKGENLKLIRNAFTVKPELGNATGLRHSNIALPADLLNHENNLVNLDSPHPAPVFADAAKGNFTLQNAEIFAGRGLDALSQGPRPFSKPATPEITGPFIYSVTATTANIEWWTDTPDAGAEILYGTDRQCRQRLSGPSDPGNYRSMSLTGLLPGTKYFFRIKLEATEPQTFTTLPEDPAPREYHVAVNGNDQASGTPEHPLRSISHACDQAKPGDSIIIHGGSYTEMIYIRNSGDAGKPMTLKSAPGEQVFLDGKGVMQQMISLMGKSNVVIDGIYFRNIVNYLSINSAAIRLDSGKNIHISRCMYDGRAGAHYTPFFVNASDIADMTFDNNVIVRGFRGARFKNCPELTIRNNVWYVNQIKHLQIFNNPAETALLQNNIFVDLVPRKFFEPLLETNSLKAFVEGNNVFLLRQPSDERLFLSQSADTGIPQKMTYPQYLKQYDRPRNSFFTNPELTILPEFELKFTGTDNMVKQADSLEKQMREKELKYDPEKRIYRLLYFSDFFANAPDCKKLQIGLEPSKFTNSGFNNKESKK